MAFLCLQEKYKLKYQQEVIKWRKDTSLFRQDQIYERLWALERGMILWPDLPPGFDEVFEIPHNRDYGIDVVDLDFTKAGQVKLYGKTSMITWTDGSKFSQYCEKIFKIHMENQFFFTTPEAKIDSILQRTYKGFPNFMQRKSFDELLANVPDVLPNDESQESKSLKIEPRTYLVETCERIMQNQKDVLKVEWPCGLGKTYIPLYLHQNFPPSSSYVDLFITPWISLARQVLKECEQNCIKACVLGDGNTEILPGTTFIICIRPSMNRIAKHLPVRFKFGDEGHHFQGDGKLKKTFEKISCQKTILLSATFYETETDFKITKREAIDMNLISDYRLILQYFEGNRTNALLEMIKNNAEWFPLFIYFNSTKKAKEFQTLLKENGIQAAFLDGKSSDTQREKVREGFVDGLINVVCLCGVWNEGESIHNIRSVVFGDLRSSSINLRQVAQRGSRLHPTKPFYNIVVPVQKSFVENDEEEDEDEDNSTEDYEHIVSVFCKDDPVFMKAVKNKSMSRLRLKMNEKILYEEEDDNEPEDYRLFCQKVFDGLGKILEGGKLSVEKKVEVLLNDKKFFSEGKGDEKFSDLSSKAMFWSNCKKNKKCTKEPYSRLLKNPAYEKDWNNYLEKKEATKEIVALSQEEKVEILLKDKKVFSKGKEDEKFSDLSSKAIFWMKCKNFKKCTKEPYSRLLDIPAYKEDWDEYLEKKEATKDIIVLSQQEKIEVLLKEEKIFSRGKGDEKFSDLSSKAKFWAHCKSYKRCLKEPYSKLLEIPAYKQDWDAFTEKFHSS